MLTLSIVIPVHDGAAVLPQCLEALKRSPDPAWECLVVEDGGSDGSFEIAQASGATVFRTPRNSGPATARNLGAAHATGDVLVFVDADVCVHADTLSRIRARFESDPGLDAVFGSYDDEPPAPNLVSQYKHLLQHYVHQHGRAAAATFWTGCGAIRREVFEALGGFNEFYARPCIEDIELGYRLRGAGGRIALDPGIQAKHLKRWSLGTLLRSDILDRALPWTRLILRSTRLPDDLNVALSQRVSAALVLASAALAVAGLVAGAPLALAGLTLAAAVVLNREFYGFLVRKRGWGILAGALPLHLAYFLYSTLAFAAGAAMHLVVWRWQAESSVTRPPVALLRNGARGPQQL